MKTLKFLSTVLVVSFLLSSCSSTKVVSDVNSEASFNELSTFAIVYELENQYFQNKLNQLDKDRLENALKKELTQRGLVETDPDNAEVKVVYQFGVQQQKHYSTTGSAYSSGYGPRRGYRGGHVHGYSSTSEYTTSDGTLTIAMYEAQSEDLLWYASAKKELKGNTKKREERINESVNTVMQDFPVAKMAETSSIK